MNLATFTLLLTTTISILAADNSAASGRDSITITNPGSGTIALWVSETQNGSIQRKVLKGSAANSTFIDDFRGQPGSVIAFSDDHPPTLITPIPWTDKTQTIKMKLKEIRRIPVTVWVVNTGGSDFETIKKKALNANVRTSEIWRKERQGIEFSSFEIVDVTKKQDQLGSLVVDKFSSEALSCGKATDIKDELNGVGFTKGRINVYYVQDLIVEGVRGSTFGEYCGSDNLVLLGVDSTEDLLAHELGHAFNLEHIDHLPLPFDKTNVMHPASMIRNFLTDGQTFRAIASKGSALNTLYNSDGQNALSVDCKTEPGAITHNCPAIEEQIWPDKLQVLSPMKPSTPYTEALEVYLGLDHEDFLKKIIDEKTEDPRKLEKTIQFLQTVLSFKEVNHESEFVALLDKGPDDQAIQKRVQFLEKQWKRREAFLKTHPTLGLKEADYKKLQGITKKEYVTQGRQQLTLRYQEKAIGALRAINTPTANGAVEEFLKKNKHKLLPVVETPARSRVQ